MKFGSGDNLGTRVGICTRYDRHECSYVATILADWLDSRGYDVTMYVLPQSRVVPQGNSWDTRHYHGSKVLFSDWCQHRDIILWSVLPQAHQLQYLKCQGACNYVLYDPHIPLNESEESYSSSDNVLALNNAGNERCRTTKTIHKSAYVPVMPSTPQYVTHNRSGGVPTVVWPIFDGDCLRYIWKKLVRRMSQFMASTNGEFKLKIVMSSTGIPAEMLREFQVWRRRYKLVTLHTQRSVLWRELHYHGADVMFWPSTVENAMLRGLYAYANGVPIVGIMATPMGELLTANKHMAVQVEQDDCDRHGYVRDLSSDIIYESLLRRLRSVVQSPHSLIEASENVGQFMAARQRVFSAAMLKLFK